MKIRFIVAKKKFFFWKKIGTKNLRYPKYLNEKPIGKYELYTPQQQQAHCVGQLRQHGKGLEEKINFKKANKAIRVILQKKIICKINIFTNKKKKDRKILH